MVKLSMQIGYPDALALKYERPSMCPKFRLKHKAQSTTSTYT